jgi:kynureninase
VSVVGSPFRTHFELDEDIIWLDTAHQGRIPNRAALALTEAVQWKLHPHMLASMDRFLEVPSRLRIVLARFLGAREDEVVLANKASYRPRVPSQRRCVTLGPITLAVPTFRWSPGILRGSR